MSEQGPPEPAYTGPEAPAWLSELLAGLRVDDPPIPDDVARRLDATLALLTAPEAPASGAAGHPAGTSDPTADTPGPEATPGAAPAAAQVTPLRTARRHAGRPGNPWPHRLLLGGVAAAGILVLAGLGTVAVIRGGSQPGGSGTVAADAAPTQQAQPVYVASGASYTAENLAATTESLLTASTASPLAASVPPPTVPPTGPSSGQPSGLATHATTGTTEGQQGPAGPLRAADSRPQPSCLASLSPDAAPLVVDEATYDKHPAFIVVFATADDQASLDVWVVARSCVKGNEGLYTFARVAR